LVVVIYAATREEATTREAEYEKGLNNVFHGYLFRCVNAGY
jgi:hypothetical protein